MNSPKRANGSGRIPVVFVHGLWLLPSSWQRWAALFEENGYTTLTPGWPDDPDTIQEANATPKVFAGKSIGQVADHFEQIIRGLDRNPPSSAIRSEDCSPRYPRWPRAVRGVRGD